MQTARQIERFWNAKQYDRLAKELLAARLEASHRLITELSQNVPAAALALIRMDELNQSHHPLTQKLIHCLLAAQESDGGWGEPLVTALCLRALLCSRGQGVAIQRGMTYLAAMQKAEGAWPLVPIRRTTEDAFVSAFILFQLAGDPSFRAAVRFDDAVQWFVQNEPNLDEDTRRLWQRASLRCRLSAAAAFAQTRGVGYAHQSAQKPQTTHLQFQQNEPALIHN
jgi:hypothetical protein